MFKPEIVHQMADEQVDMLAAESMHVVSSRDEAQTQLRKLKAGLERCNRSLILDKSSATSHSSFAMPIVTVSDTSARGARPSTPLSPEPSGSARSSGQRSRGASSTFSRSSITTTASSASLSQRYAKDASHRDDDENGDLQDRNGSGHV